MRGFVARALVIGVWSMGAAAEAQCPPDEEVAPWASLDSGDEGPGSTYAPDPGAVSLCSATSGLGETTDLYRYAFQLRDHDFVVRALVSHVDPGGSGGLVALHPHGASTHAPRVAVEVYVTPGGSALLRSSIRREADGSVDPAIADVPVTLPVMLEIRREGGEIHAGVAGVAPHLSAVVDPQGDLMGPMRVGVAQTSNDPDAPRIATFHRITVSAPEPGAEIECVDPEAAFAGAPFQIRGVHLDRVDGVRIGGIPVSFDAASPTRLVATAPASRASFLHGPVEIAQDGRYRRVGTASFVGTPIRRGDVDEDGDVTTEDYRQLCYHVYRRAELECSAAGDVDADGDRDADDVSRLKRYLSTGRYAPEAPFDESGFVEGSLACGQPARPEIHAIELADGSPLDRAIREGDDLVILGTGLPVPERAVVRFGPNAAIPAASSTPTRLAVRVGTVLEGGAQCPRIFDAEPGAEGETRFGPAFGVAEGSSLCVPFETARSAGLHLRGRMVRGQLEIDVPRDALQPGTELRISFALHLPYVVGMTRGPRAATFDFTVPNARYEDALAALADRIGRAINGSSSDECGCEVAATDVAHLEKLILPPCHLLPEVPEPPTLPGLPGQVLPTQMIWTEMDILENIPDPGCDDAIDPELEPRRFFWCQLEEVAQIQGLDALPWHQGLPLWESYEGTLTDLPTDPRDRSSDEKAIMVSPDVHDVLDVHYNSPCAMALRATRCGNGDHPWWMPPFPEGGHVIKTFWQPFANLPSSVDADSLYSYDPPGESRKYLVGMHIGYSIGSRGGDDTPPDYFLWSTFWLDAGGDTQTKGGAPLSSVYSPYCSTGFGGDKPDALLGTPFEGFSMCTDSRAGEEACGNPWAPGECPDSGTTSCTGCHIAAGRVTFAGHESSFDPDPVRVGWFASIASQSASNATACLAAIETQPELIGAGWEQGHPSMAAPNCLLGL